MSPQMEAFNRCCKIDTGGYTGLRDVTNPNSAKDDTQQSFWLAETLKVLRCPLARLPACPLARCTPLARLTVAHGKRVLPPPPPLRRLLLPPLAATAAVGPAAAAPSSRHPPVAGPRPSLPPCLHGLPVG